VSLRRRLAIALGAAALTAGVVAPAAPAAPQWREVPMPIPAGGLYRTPVGIPGDLKFWAPNRGLMTVGGNNSIPEGLYSWDGVEWHQLSTVCGGGNDARIAWAGPTEFWTITRPSPPRDQRPGLALCHFRDGEVVGSYSTPEAAADPFHEMLAAACLAPDNCWFGGVAGRDGTGARVGAFHLHWNGGELRTVYGPQGRAVSDLLAHGGALFESALVGREPGDRIAPELADPEPAPRLLHRIDGETFANDAFVPGTFETGGTEVWGLDSDGTTAWAVGGGAISGPSLTDAFFERPPLAARLGTDGSWDELTLTFSGDAPEGTPSFGDVAAIPGTSTAWVAVRPDGAFGWGGDGQATVARIAATGVTTYQTLGDDADPDKGAAWRIACPAANDCWLATGSGFLYRWSDPAAPPSYPRDTDPAFQGTITVRPNEAAEQPVPDAPPEDDSLPPAPIESPDDGDEDELPPCKPLPSLVYKVSAAAAGRTRLVVKFRLRRAVKVKLVGKRRGKVVASTKLRRLRPGKRALTLHVTAKTWPTKLSFVIKGDTRKPKKCSGSARGNNDNTVSTRFVASTASAR
jgi:hypothetical protein